MNTIFHPRPRRPLALAFTSLLAAAPLANIYAQTAPQTLATVVVTASRVEQPLAETTRDISAVDGDSLRAAGVVDVADALRLLPGVEVATTGPGATPSVFIRGANSNHTLVLVDGVRISSSTTGQSALQHVSIDQIERVEVLRGAAASLYGSDAVGGVIQIITRRDRSFSARLNVGEQRSLDASVNLGVGTAENGFSALVSQHSSKGYNAIVDPNNYSYNPDRDGYRFNTLQLNGNWRASNDLKLSGSGWITRGNAQYDGDANFDDRIKSNVYGASVDADYRVSSAWQSALRFGLGGDDSKFVSSWPSHYKTRNTQVTWQNNYRVNQQLALLGALEWRRESVSSTDGLPVTSRRTHSVVLGADYRIGALSANASARYDDNSQFGNRTTGSVGLGYALTPNLRATVNAGNSFKAPTFNDLYYPGYDNPNLKAERGQSVDAGLHWSNGAQRLGLVVYQNNVRDLISFQCDEFYNCAPQNVARARLRGATVTAGTRIAGFNLDFSYDVAEPKNRGNGHYLARRARQHGAINLSGDVYGVRTGAEVIVSGRRFDDASNLTRLPGYALLNLYASKEVVRGVRIGVRVDNVADRDYQLASGYATTGRRGWLTLSVDQ